MSINKIIPSPETEDPCGSAQTAAASLNIPPTSPQDIDLLAAEAEALEAAGVPWEWRDALRKTMPATPEEGAPCPGGFGV